MFHPKGVASQRRERWIASAAAVIMGVLTIGMQILVTVILTKFLQEKSGFAYAILEAVGAVVAIWVYRRNGSPSYKIAWMCLLLLFPVTGLILFCLWGGTHQAKQLSLRVVPPMRQRESQRMASETSQSRLARKNPAWGRLSAYLQKQNFAVYRNTDATYLPTGEAYFEDLLLHLQQAETYIFMEYFIMAEGELWDRIFSVLKERAAHGVEVCIICDDFGSLTRLSDETVQQIQEAGIEFELFNPVHRYISRLYFNYRDHRKIVVIDGHVAYTGGINVADEYANLFERFGYWKDTAVRLDGEGAWGFAMQFIHMWKMMGRVLANEDDYYYPRVEMPEREGYCQPISDGPLNNPENPVEATYLQLIASAQRMLYITTPYYVVEESMQQALCIAADGGVDVRLMVPAIPDKKYAYAVGETYWGELLRHGVKIYKYQPGFLHAKSVMVDREVALVGSTNMDYRTFYLHYETAVLMYHMPVVEQLLEDMDGIMDQSELYTLEQWERRPWYRRFCGSLLKLFAIWL